LTELSRTDAAAQIRAASRKLAALGYRTKRLTVRRRRQSYRSLPNGSIVSRSGTGTRRLTIQNGNETDAVLKLATSGRRTILGMYVRAGAVASAGGIPPARFACCSPPAATGTARAAASPGNVALSASTAT
jgi:hypothetical protein